MPRTYEPLTAVEVSVLNAPDVREWVKRALRECGARDPVDALDDAELLVRVLKARLEVVLGAPVV